MKLLSRKITAAGALLLAGIVTVILSLAGCSSAKPGSAVLGLIEAGSWKKTAESGRVLTKKEREETEISDALPFFTTTTGEPLESMEELNDEIRSVSTEYSAAKSKEYKNLVVATTASRTKKYLQATVYTISYESSWLGSDNVLQEKDRNLYSVAYDVQNDRAILCEDALEMTGMTGVELSVSMEDAFRDRTLKGQLRSTDMQGFLLDDNGSVCSIFMKLTYRPEGSDETKTAFVSFDPDTKKVTKLGFPESMK